MNPTLAELVDHPERVAEIPPAQVPVFLTKLAAVQTALAARLFPESGEDGKPEPKEDHLLDIKETARMLALSPDWLYRRASRLPFTVRIGRQLRFSHQGIEQYIRQRMGR